MFMPGRSALLRVGESLEQVIFVNNAVGPSSNFPAMPVDGVCAERNYSMPGPTAYIKRIGNEYPELVMFEDLVEIAPVASASNHRPGLPP